MSRFVPRSVDVVNLGRVAWPDHVRVLVGVVCLVCVTKSDHVRVIVLNVRDYVMCVYIHAYALVNMHAYA